MIEDVHIRYILSYIDRGIRRAVADDQAVRTSATETSAALKAEADTAVAAGARERTTARLRMQAYLEVARAAKAGSAEEIVAYEAAAKIAQQYGLATEAAGIQAIQAHHRAAAASTEAAYAETRAALVRQQAGRQIVENYLAVARSVKRGSQEQQVALQLAARAATEYGLAIEGAGRRARVASAGLLASGRTVGREERGLLAGTGALGAGRSGRLLAFGSTAFIGGFAIGSFLRGIVQRSREVQANQVLLQIALRNTGKSWQQYGRDIDDAIERTSHATGFLRGELSDTLARFIRVTGGDVPRSLHLMGVATDFARSRHLDLSAATGILIRAQLGLVGILRRQGINIQPVTRAQDALRDSHAKVTAEVRKQAREFDRQQTGLRAIAILQRQVGGSARAYLNTAAGAVDNYHRAIESLQISLGRQFLPALARGVTSLAKWVDHLRTSGQAANTAHDTLEAIHGTLQVIVPLLSRIIGLADGMAGVLGGWRRAAEFIISLLLVRRLLGIAVALGRVRREELLLTLMTGRLKTAEEGLAGAQTLQGITAIGVGAEGSLTRVAALRLGLLRLAKLGLIAVAVDLIVSRHDRERAAHASEGFLRAIDPNRVRRNLDQWSARNVPGFAAFDRATRALDRATNRIPGLGALDRASRYVEYFGHPPRDRITVTPQEAYRMSPRGFAQQPFGLYGRYGLAGPGVEGRQIFTSTYAALQRALAGARDTTTRDILAPPRLLSRQVGVYARDKGLVLRLLGAYSRRVAVFRDQAAAQQFQQRLAQVPPRQRTAQNVLALLQEYGGHVAALRDRTVRAEFAQRLAAIPPRARTPARIQRLLQDYTGRISFVRDSAVRQLFTLRLRAMAQPERVAAIEQYLAQFIAQARRGRDTATQRVFATQLVQLLPQREQNRYVKALQAAYVQASLAARGQVDGAVWARRLAGLPPAVRAAVQRALRQAEQKRQEQAAKQVLAFADEVTRSVEGMQRASAARMRIAGIDQQSAAGIAIDRQVQQATITRLQEVQQRLRAALAQYKGRRAGFAVANQIRQRLEDVNSQILEAMASLVDLAQQAVLAGIEQAQQQVANQVQLLEARAGLGVARRGFAQGSIAQINIDARTQQRELRLLEQLRGQIIERLAVARRRHMASAVKQLEQALSDVQLQIIGVLTQLAQDVQDRAAAVREARKRRRERLLARAAAAVDRAASRTAIEQAREQRLELRQQLAGTFDTGGAQRAEFIRSQVIPALRHELTELQRELRTQLRVGDRAGARQTQQAIEEKRNEILQAQLDALNAIKQNTADVARHLQGPLSFEFQNQAFTDLLGAGTGV